MEASKLYELVIKDPVVKQVFRELGERLGLGVVLNGRKAGNFNAIYVKFNIQAPNVEHRITHNLGRKPNGAILVTDLAPGTQLGGAIIEATKQPDDQYLYLKANQTGTFALMIW